jgi:hypothetical protein
MAEDEQIPDKKEELDLVKTGLTVASVIYLGKTFFYDRGFEKQTLRNAVISVVAGTPTLNKLEDIASTSEGRKSILKNAMSAGAGMAIYNLIAAGLPQKAADYVKGAVQNYKATDEQKTA